MENTMNIDLVVFDMAGTTVFDGDAVGTCFRSALATVGIVVEPAAINAVMGFHKPEAIRVLFRNARGKEPTTAEVDAIHRDFVEQMKRYYAEDSAVREIFGARQTFATLRKQGVKIALNSGFSREIIDVIVERLGWDKEIDATIASDEVPRGRPYPDMIRTLMERFGITDSKRVAKVGDTLVDLEEGTNADCGFVIGVTSGAYTREQLMSGPHTHLLSSVAELPALLLG